MDIEEQVNETPQTPQTPASLAGDGPVGPRSFVWQGVSYPLTRSLYRALQTVWGRDSVTWSEIIDAVWREKKVSVGSKRVLVTRLNDRLREIGVPLRVAAREFHVLVKVEERE